MHGNKIIALDTQQNFHLMEYFLVLLYLPLGQGNEVVQARLAERLILFIQPPDPRRNCRFLFLQLRRPLPLQPADSPLNLSLLLGDLVLGVGLALKRKRRRVDLFQLFIRVGALHDALHKREKIIAVVGPADARDRTITTGLYKGGVAWFRDVSEKPP